MSRPIDAPADPEGDGSQENEPAKKDRGLGHYLSVSLSLAIFLIVMALAAVLIVVPKAAGAIPLTVLTSSMEPGLPPGTLIIVRPVEPADLRIGDVATYQIRSGEPGVITHRITAVNTTSAGELSFTFKGDNNADVDSDAVIPKQIQGRVWYSVPYMGFVNNAVNGADRGWIIPAIAIALLAYAGWMIASGLASSVRTRRAGRRSSP